MVLPAHHVMSREETGLVVYHPYVGLLHGSVDLGMHC